MALTEIEFLHGSLTPRCVAMVDKRYPDYCSFQLMTGGTVDLSYDQQQYQLAGRWAFVAYPGPHVQLRRHPGCAYWVHRYVSFRGAAMERWRSAGLLAFAPQRPPARSDFVGRFDQMLALFHRGDSLGLQRATNLLESLLLELADGRKSRELLWLDRARELLLRLPTFRPNYGTVAEELGMSLSHFRRTFRREAGQAVHQFLLHNRLHTARHLLAETRMPIKQIARQLGYRDVFYFSRQFTKLTGTPPASFRRAG
jgi:AraC-like DNA-binding protein